MSLSTYLTGIADAIREKKGTSDKINAQDFATEIKGIETSENLDAELTAQDEALTSLESAVDKLPEAKTDRLQWICDNVKKMNYTFQYYNGESLDEILNGLDTGLVESMAYTFNGCSKITSIPQLNTSSCTNMNSAFYNCIKLKTIPLLDTRNLTNGTNLFSSCQALTEISLTDTKNLTNAGSMFMNCILLTTISPLDMIKVTSASQMFDNCQKLANLTLKNIKISLKLSSSTLLTLDSLLNTIKELHDNSSSTSVKTLTVGTANLEKLAPLYVKLIDITEDMRAEDEYIDNKKPFVQCESTDEGAMTINEYVTSKNWSIA